MYVYAVAHRRRWHPEGPQAVAHGWRFLQSRLRQRPGHYASAVDVSGNVVDHRFDLYEQAFALFGLAAAQQAGIAGAEPEIAATELLSHLMAVYRHPFAGFEEAVPPSAPLLSNPHMHLFEASIAWARLVGLQRASCWAGLADELAELCLSRLIDPRTGAIAELYDSQWRPLADASQRVEPGHQFEWGWLMMSWGLDRREHRLVDAGRRLIDLGESTGIGTPCGLVVNELHRDLSVKDDAARLWPQAERVRAWCLRLSSARSALERDLATVRLESALKGLGQFLDREPRGLWYEQLSAGGVRVAGNCRASSLYHIVGAVEAAQCVVGGAQSATYPPGIPLP